MEERKDSQVLVLLSPELDNKVLQYQGRYMIENQKRISKKSVLLLALNEFLKCYVDDNIEIKEEFKIDKDNSGK